MSSSPSVSLFGGPALKPAPPHRPDALPTEWCTLEVCPILYAYVRYQPSLSGNGIFMGLFAVLLVAQVWMGIKHKTWGYMAGMIFGLLLEIVGYFGRVKMHYNPFFRGNFQT